MEVKKAICKLCEIGQLVKDELAKVPGKTIRFELELSDYAARMIFETENKK